MITELTPGPTVYYKRRGRLWEFTCPAEHDGKVVVLGRTWNQARIRAENVFNVVIPEPQPEAA